MWLNSTMNQQMIFHLKHEFEIEFHAKLKRLYIFKVKMPKNSKTLKLIPKYNFTISFHRKYTSLVASSRLGRTQVSGPFVTVHRPPVASPTQLQYWLGSLQTWQYNKV